MEWIIEGRAWVFGDNIDTDAILPARYLVYTTEEELARYAMTGVDPEFPKKAKEGDIIVGGKNFGSGSSREHAPMGLKGLGISLVVAESFARIFYRNCINIGLIPITCKGIRKNVKNGDTLEIDLESKKIAINNNRVLYCEIPTGIAWEILKAGGLVNYAKLKIKNKD